jgi:hypothetical protein
MKLKILACSFFWLACCVLAASAGDLPERPVDFPATQPASGSPGIAAEAPSPATAPAVSAPPTHPLRDPTQIDPILARALAAGPEKDFTVQVARRGLIAIAGKPTVALIELQGTGIFCVQEGSVLTASVNGLRTTLKVQSLSRDGVVITADSKNVTVVIR